MHAFVDDVLLVYDAFGLTRVTLSTAKVKHNKKVVGRFMVQNGPLLVGHSEVSNNRFAMSAPDLKVIAIGDSWTYNLKYGYAIGITPDGLPFDVGVNRLDLYGVDGKSQGTVALADARQLEAIDLGPPLPVGAMQWTARVAMGTDGTFVVFGDGALWGGKLTGTGKKRAIANGWTLPIARTQGQYHLRAGAYGAFVSVFHPAQNMAHCALIVGGRLVKREVVACVGPVDFDGTRIAAQVSAAEVHRKPFGSAALERFEMPVTGIGTVMADGDRLLFVTADGEEIRDLVNDEVFDRGLPEAERPNREKVLAFIETFRAPASAANLTLRLEALRPPAYGAGPRPDWTWDEGDQSLLRICVIGNLIARQYEDRELSAGSYSNPMYCARGTEAAVEQLLAAVEAYGLDLLAGIAMLDTALGYNWEAHRYGKETKPLFEKAAARRLLWAVIERVTGESLGPVPEKLTPALVIAKLDPSTEGWRRGQHSNAQTAASLLVLDYFEQDAAPVLIDWLVLRPSGMVSANLHIVSKSAACLVKAYPAAKSAFAGYPALAPYLDR